MITGYQPKVPMKNSKVDITELFKRKAEQQLAYTTVQLTTNKETKKRNKKLEKTM